MENIILAIGFLCVLALALAVLLLVAEFFLANYGECEIDINSGEKVLKVKGGSSLLGSLTENKVFIPSACGGRGSCGFCKCKVISGGGPLLPTEEPYLSADDVKNGVRLSCQVKVKEDLKIELPAELLSVKEFNATVEKVETLTHDIRGVRFRLPEGEKVKFKAGQYFQLFVPPYEEVHETTNRAYSIASRPSDDGAIELIIRLVPNGIVTTYVFDYMKEGDKMRMTGPFGDFYLTDTDRECIFIAGGSGLAPFRSMIYDMIEKGNTRKVTFFFGAREVRDLYFVEEMKKFEEEHDWFHYVPSLSGDETGHGYKSGLITDTVANHYGDLAEFEAYLCGSPGMIDACVNVLTGKGLPQDRIYYDKFS